MTYRTEFPKFNEADLPEIPAGFTDTSFHDDVMPSFEHAGLGWRLHVDHADPSRREDPEGRRFGLYQLVPDGAGGWCWPSDLGDDMADPVIIETDDWAEVLASITYWIARLTSRDHS